MASASHRHSIISHALQSRFVTLGHVGSVNRFTPHIAAALAGLTRVEPQVIQPTTSASTPRLLPCSLRSLMQGRGLDHIHQKRRCHPPQGSTPPRARTARRADRRRGLAPPKCWPARHKNDNNGIYTDRKKITILRIVLHRFYKWMAPKV